MSLNGTLGKDKNQSMAVDAEMHKILRSVANCVINIKLKLQK